MPVRYLSGAAGGQRCRLLVGGMVAHHFGSCVRRFWAAGIPGFVPGALALDAARASSR